MADSCSTVMTVLEVGGQVSEKFIPSRYAKCEIVTSLAIRRVGLTASGLVIWRNYLPLATFSQRESGRRYPLILALQLFVTACAL